VYLSTHRYVISLENRVKSVRRYDDAHHDVDLNVVLDTVHVKDARGQTGDRQAVRREPSLIGEVVDREHRSDGAEDGVGAVDGGEQRGHEPGVPIVAVNDRGGKAERRHGLERGPREEAEALEIVPVLAAPLTVEAWPVEVGVVLDQVERRRCERARSMKHPETAAPLGQVDLARRLEIG